MAVCAFVVDWYIWSGFKEKKDDFYLVSAKETYHVAYGYCNLFTGMYPDRSLEALASIFQVCISYKIMKKNSHFHWEKDGLCHSKLCILCNTPN